MRTKKIERYPLHALRIKNGYSSKDIASAMEVTPAAVNNWLSCRYLPRPIYITKLAEMLNTTPKYIRKCYLDNTQRVVSSGRYRPNNFWTTARANAGFTINEVTEMLNPTKDKTTVAKYFSGEIVPPDAVIQDLCKSFDVDYKTGKAEFEKANAEWKSLHRKEPKNLLECTQDLKETTKTPMVELKKVIKVEPYEVGKLIYDSVPYDEFIAIMNAISDNLMGDSVLKAVYGNVDCDTFLKLYKLLGES